MGVNRGKNLIKRTVLKVKVIKQNRQNNDKEIGGKGASLADPAPKLVGGR